MGALLIAMSASGGLFTELVGTLRDWLGRQSGGHSITVTNGGETLTIEAASADQQHQLIDDFRQRYTAGG